MQNELFYRPSGRFRPAAPLLILGGALPVGLLSGALYGGLTFYNPFVYANALALGLTAVWVGQVVWWLARASHLRSPLLAGACGAVAGLAAIYAAWVAWIFVLCGMVNEGLFTRPVDVVCAARQISQTGAWSLFGAPVAGTFLQSIWGLEALAFVGIAALWPVLSVVVSPYSERSGRWADQAEELPPLAVIPVRERKAFALALRRGQFEVLGALRPAQKDDHLFTACTGRTTNPPGDEVFLTLESVDVRRDHDGQRKVVRTSLASNLIADTEAWDVIRELARPSPVVPPAVSEPTAASGLNDAPVGSDSLSSGPPAGAWPPRAGRAANAPGSEKHHADTYAMK